MTETPSQTVGPFFGIGLPYDGGPEVVAADHPGMIILHGRVLDGEGTPIPDALLEIWQDAGFGRCPTDASGEYRFRTVRPDGHIALLVFARGLLKPVLTRIHFDEADVDPAVPADRRGTLVATADDGSYRFDVRLQGDGETVFFGH
jgi:protocatechuate 3,4-dioxygenase, alpha subunit